MDQGEYWLDVATGPGTAIFEALCTFDKFPAFTGVDASYEMLHGANSIQEGIFADIPSDIEFSYGDAHRLSFADEMFDGLFSNLGIHLFSERTKAINEMRRILKRDGSLTVTIPYLIPESYQLSMLSVLDGGTGDWLTELSGFAGKQNSILGEIENELEAAGFSGIQVAEVVVPYACSGVQEVIGLLKTVLHFSGCLSSADQIHAFTLLDNFRNFAPVWEDTTTYAVKLGVARITCVKQEI